MKERGLKVRACLCVCTEIKGERVSLRAIGVLVRGPPWLIET